MTLSSFSFILLLVVMGALRFAIYFMQVILVVSVVMAAAVIWYFYPFKKRSGYPGRKED